jgi:hypothetical protein
LKLSPAHSLSHNTNPTGQLCALRIRICAHTFP